MPDTLDVSLSDPSSHPDESKGTPSYIGVTRTLSAANLISSLEVTAEILERGSQVHLACKFLDQFDFDRRTLPHRVRGFVNAWKRFRDENSFRPRYIEHFVENEKYNIRGTLDRAGPIAGIKSVPRAIVEIATGTLLPYKALQMSAYGFLLDPKKIFRRIGVELHEDATYRMEEFPIKDYLPDLHVFFAATRVNDFKRRHGL